MTAAETRLWTRLQGRAAQLRPRLARALIRGFERLEQEFGPGVIHQLARSPSLEVAVAGILDEPTLDRALGQVRAELQAGLRQAARQGAYELPARARLGVSFNVLNPRAVDAARHLDTTVIQTLKAGVRQTVREHVAAGVAAGLPPSTIARELRDVIGLAPNQAAAVRSFRDALEVGERRALTRGLRDRRFDATLRRALAPGGPGLSGAQVDRMTDAYRRRFIAWNANTNARTAAGDAVKLGRSMAWQDAAAAGFIPEDRLMRRWATVLDGRERPEHHDMNGELVPAGDPYSNGDSYAGEGDPFNCRCMDVFFVAREPVEAGGADG